MTALCCRSHRRPCRGAVARNLYLLPGSGTFEAERGLDSRRLLKLRRRHFSASHVTFQFDAGLGRDLRRHVRLMIILCHQCVRMRQLLIKLAGRLLLDDVDGALRLLRLELEGRPHGHVPQGLHVSLTRLVQHEALRALLEHHLGSDCDGLLV